MHSAETTLHKKITKHKFEAYPYAIWVEPGRLFSWIDRRKNVDVGLLGWGSKTKSKYKYYYLKLSEFYDYIGELLRTITHLIPIANNIVEENREKNRCKTLKKPAAFNNFSEYCLYLRKRIYIKLSGDEIPDGGLLLASHILDNEKIDKHFKKWIKTRVLSIANKMLQDINSIEYDEIFSELRLGAILKCKNAGYISEKFHNYLHEETIREIETNIIVDFKASLRFEENNLNYSNPGWSAKLLIDSNEPEIIDAIKKAYSYADLYELVLEIIYKRNLN